MEAAVTAHLTQQPPQNVFAPFSIASHTPSHPAPSAAQPPKDDPTLHWGNVDTGSMINLVYQGVLATSPELNEYWENFYHQVRGVGSIRTAVVGKLVGVPLCLGA